MTNELVISTKKAATRGKIKNASGGGLCNLVTAVMLAMAVGVASKQNHQIFGIITTFITRRSEMMRSGSHAPVLAVLSWGVGSHAEV